MADEIKVSVSLKCTNGLFEFARGVSNKKVDQTTQGGGGPGTVSVTTSELSQALTGYGWVLIRNLDLTNFVQLGFVTTVYPLVLDPDSAPMLIRMAAAQTLFLKADTATCKVEIVGVNL